MSDTAHTATVDATSAFAGHHVRSVPIPGGGTEDAIILGKTGVDDYMLRTDSGVSFKLSDHALRPLLSTTMRRLL